MKRTTKFLVTGLFFLVLVAPPASILLPIEPVEIENRPLERPDISLRNLTDPSFVREVLRYALDANPMRTLLIRVGAGLDFWVFDDTPDPRRVLRGTDDWLYFRPTLEDPCAAPPERVVANIVRFVNRLERDVPMVVLTVAPSKFTIHPEHLTLEQAELADCAATAVRELRAALAASPIDHYVDGWELFEQLKSEGTQPYFRTDTHFNFEGSIPWMRAVVEEAGGVWDPASVHDQGDTMFLGNLMRYVGLEQPEQVRRIVVERGLDQEVTEISPHIRRYRHSSKSDQQLIEEEALVLGDSFLELPESSLVQFFADVTTTYWRDDEAVNYFLHQAAESQVVIIEVSELHIWERFADTRFLDAYDSQSEVTTSRSEED